MALAAIMIVDIFTGFSAKTWNAWVFVTVFFGIVVIWFFTVIYSAISPGYAVTTLYGSYYILLASPYFWLSLPITFFLSLAPRFIARSWKASYTPDDLDIMRYISKYEPDRDFARDAHISNLNALQRPGSAASQRRISRSQVNESLPSMVNPRHASRASVNMGASRTDLATGVISTDRGFDFAQEEGGVALRRMQTNLSEAVASRQQIDVPRRPSMKGKETLSHMFSLRRSPRKKKSTKQSTK
ncbi:hypothetical protein C0993_008408 [Termitomyces sp. T159_Od127]|nr:hypothetical protein C0993_008408 [Termitomyces sp. T159_Od127]